MNSVAKAIHMLPQYSILAFKKASEYKVAFYTFIITQIVQVTTFIIFWNVIFGNIGVLGQWTFPMMLLLLGFNALHNSVWGIFTGIWNLPNTILTGEFNMHLIRPTHPMLHLILSKISLYGAGNLFIGIGLLIYTLTTYTLPFTTMSLLLALLISSLSIIVVLLPFVILLLSAFWIGQAEFLRDIFAEIFTFEQYPLTEFPAFFVITFTFIVPIIFAGALPVLILLHFTTITAVLLLVILILIIIGQITLFNIVWKKGLRRYESHGG